jgi:hypothetical protein
MKKKLIYLTLLLFAGTSFYFFNPPKFNPEKFTLTIPDNQNSTTFTSPIITTKKFNTLLIKFQTSGKGEPKFFAWFNKTKNQKQLELECEKKICTGFITTALTKNFQFKIKLNGEPNFQLKNLTLETKNFSTKKKWEILPQALANLTNLEIISRKEWGADSKYLLKRELPNSSGKISEAWKIRQAKCAEMQKKYPEEFQTDGRIIYFDDKEQELHWPQTYSSAIKKIIIHNTASDGNKDVNGDGAVTYEDMESLVQAIYYYHSMFKGWGDIGYNYLIDRFGNIYEGRRGGDFVVGGHAYCANIGSIGVAFIGTFTEKLPTLAAQNSAKQLLASLADFYNLQLTASSKWHDQFIRNLAGHRDYGATRCPGNELYEFLPELAAEADNLLLSKKSANMDFSYQVLTNNSPLELDPLSNDILKINLKNNGKKIWSVGSEFVVSAKNIQANQFGAKLNQGKNVVAKLIRQVKPNDNIEIEIPVTSGLQSGIFYFGIEPKFDETELHQFFVVAKVQEPILDYEVIDAKWPPQPFPPETEAQSFVKIQNKTNFTWFAAGENRVYLGTVNPENEPSPFSPNNSAELATLAKDTRPGEVGFFEMNLRAPKQKARYWLNFAPAIKNFGYLPDYNLRFHITVREPHFVVSVIDRTLEQNLILGPGQKKEIFLELENLSQVDWDPEQFKLKVVQSGGVGMREIDLYLTKIIPQKTSGKIIFPITTPKQTGDYKFILQPTYQCASSVILKDQPIDFLVKVEPAQLSGKLIQKPFDDYQLDKNETAQITIAYENTGNLIWSAENTILQRLPAEPSQLSDETWLSLIHPATLQEAEVLPGAIGHFQFTIKNNTDEKVTENFVPMVKGLGRIRGKGINLKTGNLKKKLKNKNQLTKINNQEQEQEYQQQLKTNNQKPIRIRLSFNSDQVKIGGGDLRLWNNLNQIVFQGNFLELPKTKFIDGAFFRVEPLNDTVLEIVNWEHHPGWTDKFNDNKFRGILEVQKIDNDLVVINELPLEDYLRGIAEPAPDDPVEKKKLMAILARSYALYYTNPSHRKFPGQPYDGSDNPAEFQKYLGYNYELRGDFAQFVEETQGLVVTYNSEVVKTPYFTSSDGRTKTPAEVGWIEEDFLFVRSVPDPWSCDLTSAAIGTEFSCPENARGHGVGVSGMGAKGLALEGFDYKEILDYFFTGVEVLSIDP